MEINEEDENDDYGEDEEVTFEDEGNFEKRSDTYSQSVERPDFSLDKNINLNNQKDLQDKQVNKEDMRKKSIEHNPFMSKNHQIKKNEEKLEKKAKRHELFKQL